MASKQPKWTAHKIVKRPHVIKASKIWSSDQRYGGFKDSTTYDVVIKGKKYPPKAISAIAYELAGGPLLKPTGFAGSHDGYWHQILKNLGFEIFTKISDGDFERQVSKLEKLSDTKLKKLALESGATHPHKVKRETETYVRSAAVKAYALRLAKGKCQCCKKPGPFLKKDNTPYLEVHHKVPLSKRGADVIENVMALCPNCHAKVHYETGLDWDVV